MINGEITSTLFEMRDIKYRDFQSKLIPSKEQGAIIGVRTPALKQYAKQLAQRDDVKFLLEALPHDYFDEDQLHAFIISDIKDYQRCIEQVNRFLPHIDNWATCDQLSPKIFKKHKKELERQIELWLQSKMTYTVRFAIGMLMKHFLDEDFKPSYLDTVSKIESNEYYVNMMIAWFFQAALSKQYKTALPYIENHLLPAWIHNKTIQKCVESRTIPIEQKEYLRGMRRKM